MGKRLNGKNLTTKNIEEALIREFYMKGTVLNNVNGSGEICNMHECDVLHVTKSGYGYEYEIKVSKADIRADRKKDHKHSHRLIKATTFVVPEELKDFALENVPSHFGVAYMEVCTYTTHDVYYLRSVRDVTYNKDAVKWTEKQVNEIYKKGYYRYLNSRVDS